MDINSLFQVKGAQAKANPAQPAPAQPTPAPQQTPAPQLNPQNAPPLHSFMGNQAFNPFAGLGSAPPNEGLAQMTQMMLQNPQFLETMVNN